MSQPFLHREEKFTTTMSFFLGNSSQYSYAEVDPEKVKLADIQFSIMSATFNRALAQCEAKCLPHEYGEGDINTGEASCIDRCVAKYVKANALMGQKMQNTLVPGSMPEYRKVAQMSGRK